MSFSEVIACNYMCVRLQHSIITNNSMGIIRQFKRHLHYVCFLYASARSLVQSSNFPMQRSNILKQNRVPDCLLSLHYFNVSISSYSSFLCLNVLNMSDSDNLILLQYVDEEWTYMNSVKQVSLLWCLYRIYI